jgi:hypothetical protein
MIIQELGVSMPKDIVWPRTELRPAQKYKHPKHAAEADLARKLETETVNPVKSQRT